MNQAALLSVRILDLSCAQMSLRGDVEDRQVGELFCGLGRVQNFRQNACRVMEAADTNIAS